MTERKECNEVILSREDLLNYSCESGPQGCGEGRHTSRLLPMMLGTNSCNISSMHAGWKNLLVVSAMKPIWYVVWLDVGLNS